MSVLVADCIEAMAAMGEASIDAVVADPPYGIAFMGHEWDQPGEFGPVRANGQPGPFVRGGERRQPPGQRRVANPKASGFGTMTAAKRKKLGARGAERARDGAMEAGRYDLSLSANRRFQAWCEAWGEQALRVLKPGGHLVCFGAPRTYHRLTAGLEDAGFEIRDCFMWLFGSGFPKSLNLEGEWEGWGTAVKPAWEPIVLARKPYVGTVAGNVAAQGTGALHIAACRIGGGRRKFRGGGGLFGTQDALEETTELGRWPANALLSHTEDCVLVGERRVRGDGHFPAARGPSGYGSTVLESNGGGLKGQEDLDERHLDDELVEEWACVPGCPVRMLDEQAGQLRSGANPTRRNGDKFRSVYGEFAGGEEVPARGLDVGGASRFFYCAKASRAEREAGLDGFESKPVLWSNGEENPGSFQSDGTERSSRNPHPTVKPIEVMRWLLRLVVPPGGRVLDPFAGSGTTGCACALEGFGFVGVERKAEYAAVADARIRFWLAHPSGLPAEVALEAATRRRRVREAGQLGLLD